MSARKRGPERDSILVRFPQEMGERIRTQAEDSGRSLSNEVVYLLKEIFKKKSTEEIR